MNYPFALALLAALFLSFLGRAQTGTIQGRVTDNQGQPISGVNIYADSLKYGTATDAAGNYSLRLPANRTHEVQYRFVGYRTQTITITLTTGQELTSNITLLRDTQVLKGVEIVETDKGDVRQQISTITLPPITAKKLPSAFGDFSKILTTLAGVSSNNELSSTYSVRGGNYDENLVYVNDMPVYRPFLIRAGRQEGLSFVNPDLVQSVQFSAGGWQPKYGDKLSSTLNIEYKKPDSLAGSATLGLLGGSAHLEYAGPNKNTSYLLGVRHKSAQYLLNTLETNGQYLPRFTDLQLLVSHKLTQAEVNGKPKTSIDGLFAYARNRYLVRPETRQTDFGTINQVFRFFVFFEGQELLEYDTWQGSLRLNHAFSERFRTSLTTSGFVTREREYFDVEGFYRLCDVNNDPGTDNFNECVGIRGAGSNFSSGRNLLEAGILNIESRSVVDWNANHATEFGVAYTYQDIEDELDEYNFTDSADFVTIDELIVNNIDLNVNVVQGYVQHTAALSNRHVVTAGVRFNYRDLSDQLLISPRLQFAYKPGGIHDVVVKAAAGLYRQHPFYREMRDRAGQLNTDVQAQNAAHFIAGIDYALNIWGRPFKFVSEVYYKYLWDIIPYDIDNVRLRYFATNSGTAYAAGLDFRINGEFIPGTESWFSLGLLRTREDVDGDGLEYIRRPTDQAINLGIYFEDHFPNDPSLRMNLGLQYGSGLPFGPPGSVDFRNVFNGDPYQRVDVGFSKLITFKQKQDPFFKTLWIGLDVLNLLGADNPISYTWITDVNNVEFGIPNSLSARFFNLKVVARY